jgi:hypothetical protein
VVSGSPWANTGLFRVNNDFVFGQIDAAQLGTSTTVETNDPRLLNVVLRNGHLWTTHSGGLPTRGKVNRTAAFWYEINPAAMPTPIVQSGYVENGAGTHYFFPSITVNANNDVALGFSYSDAGQYVEGAYTGRESTDPPGTMGAVTTCKEGEDSYIKDYGYGRVRWGDYSATVVDPTDDLTFWTLQQYAATDVGSGSSDDRWGTWWCRVQIGNFWQGGDAAGPTFWSVPANWSSGVTPTCGTDAVIPTSPVGGVFPEVNADANVRNLTVAVGADINMESNTLSVCGNLDHSGNFNSTGGTVSFSGGITQGDLTISGDWTNDGIFQHDTGTITFNAPISQIIGGGAVTTFSNMTVADGTTVVLPGVNQPKVNGTLTQYGTFHQTLDVAPYSTVAFMEIVDSFDTVVYRGVEITTVSTELGEVLVVVREVDTGAGEYCTTTGADSPDYAERCFEIIPSNPDPDLPATVRLWAPMSSLNGIDPGELAVYRFVPTSPECCWIELLANHSTGSDLPGYSYVEADTPGFSSFLMGKGTGFGGNEPTVNTLSSFKASSGNTAANLLLWTVGIVLAAACIFLARYRRSLK